MSRRVQTEVARFLGLSDRAVPAKLSKAECPDLLNVDVKEMVLGPRLGWQRTHTNLLRDCSIRVDGINDYILFPDQPEYDVTNRFYLGFDFVLRDRPAATVTLLQRGYGTGANLFFSLQYDPTVNSNNGGWVIRAYDAGGGALRTVTINDGDGNQVPLNLYRHLDVYWSGTGNVYNVRILTGTGTTVGAAGTMTIASWVSSAEPWTLGVSESGAATIGTDFSSFTAAELRLGDYATVPTCNGVYQRELDTGPGADETTGLIAYFKLNEGNGSRVFDNINDFEGIAVREGPEWETNQTLVCGTGGIRWTGGDGFLFHPTNAWGTSVMQVSGGSADAYQAYTISCCFTPLLAPGESTVRDQYVWWMGTNATDPAPMGIRVVSDVLVLSYLDSGGTPAKTVTHGLALSTVAGQRLRIIAYKSLVSGTDYVNIAVQVDGGTYTTGTPTAVAAGNTTVSTYLTIGNRISSGTPPTQAGVHGYGIVSDFFVIDRVVSGSPTSVAAPPAFTNPPGPFVQRSPYEAQFTGTGLYTDVLAVGIYMDEGDGNLLYGVGSFVTAGEPVAYLYPQEEDGIRWDIGLVDPYDPPEVTLLYDYDKIDAMGRTVRQKLAICGSTLHEIDEDAQTATPIQADLHKGTYWTVAQYGDVVILAGDNGRRPRKLVNGTISWLGLREPFTAPVTAFTTTGGSLPDSNHTVYVTFRNGNTGEESNPSPPDVVAIAGGGGAAAITTIGIPVSSDPQVTERRIYVTNATGAGTTAYLQRTIGDNVTTSVTANITSIDTTTTILEYNDNAPPPIASIVTVSEDRVLVAGNPIYPTRVWYSSAGVIGAFNQLTGYEEADQNSGDPVTALLPLGQRVAVHLGDARAFLQPTGSASQPFIWTDQQQGRGCVGPRATTAFENLHFFLGERSILLWNGATIADLTSPLEPNQPSIEYTMRQTVDAARRYLASIVYHNRKNQLFVATSQSGETRNSMMLVYNMDTGAWSKWLVDADIVAEMDDENDDPLMYAGIRGYVCKLNAADYDGVSSPVSGTATGGTTSTLVDSAASFTTAMKGLYVHWLDMDAGIARKARIRKTSATTLYFYSTTTAPAADDPYTIGPIPWFADFLFDFGQPLRRKRLLTFRALGYSSGETASLRLCIRPKTPQRSFSYAGTLEYKRSTWDTTTERIIMSVGSAAMTHRVRITQSGAYPTTWTSTEPYPDKNGRIFITDFLMEAEEVEAK